MKLQRGEKNKDRINKNEPKPETGIPQCPAILDKEAKREWKRMAKLLFGMGCLSKVDKAVFVAYCTAWALFVQSQSIVFRVGPFIKTPIRKDSSGNKLGGGNIVQNPAVVAMNKAMADMVRFGTELGMTPSSRSRIQVPKSDKSDPFSDLLD